MLDNKKKIPFYKKKSFLIYSLIILFIFFLNILIDSLITKNVYEWR